VTFCGRNMIRFLKPTKLKFLAMALVWASIWCADELEDIIGDPLIRRASPEIWTAVEDIGRQVDESEGEEEQGYLTAGLIAYGAEWLSRGLVSYLCACLIMALAGRKGTTEQHARQVSTETAPSAASDEPSV